ncbi:MAG: ribosome recycling factor, partial [Christensenellaceae bacterium]|nr:ribosome recycling factor [Christensenellaceae bacterium]
MDYSNENVNATMLELEDALNKKIVFVKGEFATIRAGRVDTHILDRVTMDYYGTQTAITKMANVSCQDARTILINPWDTAVLAEMVKVLSGANLGASPVDDGRVIRLVFPQLTSDTRKELVKKVKKIAEEAKVGMRNDRRTAIDRVKKIKNEEKLGEDEVKTIESDVQKMLDSYIGNIDN